MCLQTFQNKNKTQPIILTVNTTHTPNQTQTQPTTTNPNPNQAKHSTHTYLRNEAAEAFLKEAIRGNLCTETGAMVPKAFGDGDPMGWESDARGVHSSGGGGGGAPRHNFHPTGPHPPGHEADGRAVRNHPPRGGRATSGAIG